MAQLSTSLISVTVYPGQARITRQGRITLPPGDHMEVLLTDLPLTLVHESVRVSGRGTGAITGIDVRTTRHATDRSARIAALLAERQRLAVAAQAVADERRALDVRLTMLESVAGAAGRPYARQLAAGMTADEVGPVAERIAAQVAEVLATRRTLLDEDKRISDEQARIDRDLGLPDDQAPDRTEVAVAVAPGEGGELEFEVSYLVEGATWEPRYDLRLDEDTGEVEVTWFGMVRQWSGEDWPASELRLSTARPTAAITIPDLDPWYLSERVAKRAPAMPMAFDAAAGAPVAMSMAAAPARSAMQETAEPVAHAEAVMEMGATAATYVVEQPVSVPSDGSDHQALITTFRLPAEIDHVTAPVASDDVFLRASVTNSSAHTLRAGRASLFHGSEFVGVSDLEVVAPREKVELALGLDDRIRVRRELVARHVDKALLGGTARNEARWRTTVANHAGKPARITVIDQAPVSRAAGITVKSVKTVPDTEVSQLGEVTWHVELADGEEAKLELWVRVEVARGTTLLGWRD
ncbi:MAG: DUF4139 domain-containing protein [Propionibacteriaceae bacterium]|nr:DUF4139 domain-containing protein [Propionibacteriaceae bacterium]